MEGLRVYRRLLANGPLSRLLVGEFISGIGDWLYIVAIFVVIYRESGDAALVGAFGAVRLLPYVVLSIPAGFVADRFERRMVLLVSDLIRGAIMVVLAVLSATNAPTLWIAAFAILAAAGSTFFYPAIGAYLPTLAEDERQLGPANSAWASLNNISFIIGPAIGGLLLAVGSVTMAFVVNAVTFVVIAAILWRLPSSSRASRASDAAAEAAAASALVDPAPPTGTSADGSNDALPSPAPDEAIPARSRLRLRPLTGLTVIQLAGGFLGGGFQVITVILAIDVLKAGEEANGYLNAAIGVGGLIGGIGAGALVLRRGLGMPLIVGAVVTGIGTAALGAATNLTFALVAIGVSSAGALILDILSTTLFQRLVPNELMGRAVGVLMAVSTLTSAAGALMLPVLLQTVGPFESLAGAGIATLVVTVAGTFLIGPAADREPTPYEAVLDHIATLDLFTGVPRSRLQAAMHKLKEVPVSAGENVVRQGEPADRFYIIASGTFAVTQVQRPGAAAAFLRQLGPDAVFGELGLLNSGPRTATVTAETDGVVLALEGRDFLTLVGASSAFQGRLRGLYVGGAGR